MENLQKQIDELKNEIELLKNSATIPFTVDSAFRDRFSINDLTKLSASSKDVATVTQAVNEAGTSSYDVATPVDGFFTYTKDGIAYSIPYYN